MGLARSEAAELAYERAEDLARRNRGYCEVHLLLVEWSGLPQLRCAIARALNDGRVWSARSQIVNDIEQSSRGAFRPRSTRSFQPHSLLMTAQNYADAAGADQLLESHLCRALVELGGEELGGLGLQIKLLTDYVQESEIGPSRLWPQAEPREPMVVRPLFRARGLKTNLEIAFVLMPFRTEWADRVWDTIAHACDARGLRAVRADHMHGAVISEDIWRGIVEARLVIADVTEANPNVYYELGVVHTVGKDCVLISQSTEHLPFDTRALRHITYRADDEGTKRLHTALLERLDRL